VGYSHYWIIADPIEGEAWQKFRDGAEAIIQIAHDAGIPVHNASDSESINFNGTGVAAHETFVISQGDAEFDFCKTAQKPYDTIVCAVLIHLKAVLGDGVLIKSDGKWDEDWESAQLLYETTFDIQPENVLNGNT
jgi:hypothetical protein